MKNRIKKIADWILWIFIVASVNFKKLLKERLDNLLWWVLNMCSDSFLIDKLFSRYESCLIFLWRLKDKKENKGETTHAYQAIGKKGKTYNLKDFIEKLEIVSKVLKEEVKNEETK